MSSIYCDYINCITDIENLLNKDEFNYIQYSFIFGSLSRKLIHENSDIDLLLIGNKPKTINLINKLSSSIDNCLRVYKDVDIKYYMIDDFRKLRNSNLFLKEIEKDCKELSYLKHELLRFCT